MLTKKTFANGLRLLTIPMPWVKTVTVLVLVGVGGRYEREKTNGLTHFLEHMLFQGTEKYPNKMSLGIAVDEIGAEYNGWTDKEHTAYFIKAESKHLGRAVEVLSELVCHPRIKKEEIEAERNVILQEIAMREDNPQVLAVDKLWETVFEGNPLGLSGTGEKKSIITFQRDNFLDFKRKFYTADNTVVVVAGNFPQNEAEEQVEKSFLSLEKGEGKSFEKFLLKQKTFRKKIIDKKTEQAHLVLGFPGFSRTSDKKYVQSLLDVILGGGFSSRLFQKIREELRLAYYVGSEAESYLDTGIFACFAGLDKNNVNKGLKAIWEELERVTRSTANVTREELRKAKDYLRGHLVLKLEEPMDVATFYGIREVLLGKTEEPEEILSKVEKVTTEEIAEVASIIFKPEKASLVVVGEKIDKNLDLYG